MDKETVKKIASLARIEMDDETLERMTPEIAGIMTWIEQLSEVNTDDVEPLASPVNLNLTLREDVMNDGDCVEKILANAPEKTQGFFVVPKVVDQES